MNCVKTSRTHRLLQNCFSDLFHLLSTPIFISIRLFLLFVKKAVDKMSPVKCITHQSCIFMADFILLN